MEHIRKRKVPCDFALAETPAQTGEFPFRLNLMSLEQPVLGIFSVSLKLVAGVQRVGRELRAL